MLVFPNGMEQVIFAGPGHDLTYEATANDLKNYVVNGSDENTLMNQFRQETYTQNPSETKVTARRYIKDTPLSPVAIHLFDQYFVQDDEVSHAEVAELLKTLKAKHPHNRHVLDIESKIHSALHRQVGQTLADVTLTRPAGTTTRLWNKKQDYTLVAFWSLWMQGGYDFLWRLRQCADKYTSQSHLRIVAISLDLEESRWQETVRPDSARSIEHYCDGLAFESEAIKRTGIHTIPFYLLTDSTRRILDSGSDPSQMEDMLQKHLKPQGTKAEN